MRRFLSDTRGASAVEFSIVVIPFLVVVFGIFEFSRLYWTQNAIQQAAIAGARCVGIGHSDCASEGVADVARTQGYVEKVAGSWLVALSAKDVTVTTNAGCHGLAGFSKVSISYEFQTSLPRILVPLADGVRIEESSCFPSAAPAS